MISPRLFLCNNAIIPANDPRTRDLKTVSLSASGSDANVDIKVEDVARVFMRHLSPRMTDLLEIASYVYAADCATSRGKGWQNGQATEPWSRELHFLIPVRDFDFWAQESIVKLLSQTLNFLSDDTFHFEFQELVDEIPVQQYLAFNEDEDWPFNGVERVLMFSGGLDSLAGAIDTAETGANLVLVSHRTVPTISKRQKDLFRELRANYPNPMIHIPVWINKSTDLGIEHTQRTRSFLYSALGTVVAHSLDADGVRFFENGIVSLNLPVADEVLRARASRTTHPKVLNDFTELYSLILDRELIVDNPFIFRTKTEVVQRIADFGRSSLIKHTCSCAHTAFKSKLQWHCGTCSQCIDRRFAILASKLEDYDPAIDYVCDVFTGGRKEGYQQNMAVDYVRHALELDRLSDEQIASIFNLELSRATRPFPDRRQSAVEFIRMHKRHANTVASVLQEQVKLQAQAIVSGNLDNKSLLGLVVGNAHRSSIWERFAERITDLLRKGLPIACKSVKPQNEPHLQEICDGILAAEETNLIREFPFLRWSSSSTKPDWSAEELNLWIELKYVRKKTDIRQITEDIAADITKYGDNLRRVLFMIYDPSHLIVDEAKFSEPIVARETMRVEFIR